MKEVIVDKVVPGTTTAPWHEVRVSYMGACFVAYVYGDSVMLPHHVMENVAPVKGAAINKGIIDAVVEAGLCTVCPNDGTLVPAGCECFTCFLDTPPSVETSADVDAGPPNL